MRIHLLLIPCILATTLIAPLRAESGGAPAGSSGAPGDTTCTACHGGTANSGRGRVRIEFGDGGAYSSAQKVRMRVIVEDPSASRWGFQLSARAESDTSSSAGTLSTVDDQTRVQKAGLLEWITHTLSGTRRGASSPVTFEFDWTAPANGAGPVVFYAAANAANGNGNTSGDTIYTSTLRVTEASGGVRPSFSSESVSEAWTNAPGIAAGAWVNITGTNLADRDAHWSPASGRPLETTLAGVTVKINHVPAALSFVSPTRIQLLVPAATPEGDISVVVERDTQSSGPVAVRSSAVLPAIHSVPESASSSSRFFAAVSAAGAGTNLGLISSKGWLLGKPEVDPRVSRGVFPGEEIDIYVIGLGRTDPEFPTDRLFTGSFGVVDPPAVRFGDLSVVASSATLVSPGLYVVRVKTPDTLAAGDIPIAIDVKGLVSAPNVFLTIQEAR